jgi:hypothetical protein
MAKVDTGAATEIQGDLLEEMLGWVEASISPGAALGGATRVNLSGVEQPERAG